MCKQNDRWRNEFWTFCIKHNKTSIVIYITNSDKCFILLFDMDCSLKLPVQQSDY